MSIYKHINNLSEIELNGGYTEYMCNCPKCKREGRKFDDYKLGISLTKNVFHCYRCGWKGSVDFLLRGSVSNQDLLEYRFRDISGNKEELLESEVIDYDNVATKIDIYCYDAVSYLKKRGIGIEEIGKYDIRLGKGLYHNRLTIPVYDDYGNVVYLTARDYLNSQNKLRYINPPQSHKSLFVWNLNNAKENDKIILTEGVFSGISADMISSNFIGVCVFGKVISDKQAKLIAKKNLSEIVLSFDGDVSDKEIRNNYNKLRLYNRGKITILKLPDKEDPNSINKEDYYKCLINRKSIDDYLMLLI